LIKITNSLLNNCINNDSKAQKELYEMLLPYLRAIVQRYLRDNSYSLDVLQETFVKIFRSISNYDSSISPFKNWAAKIAVNSCLNFNARVINKRVEELTPDLNNIKFKDSDVEIYSDEYLLSVLKSMPQQLYNVFNLSVIDGYSHAEIAKIIGISEVNSRTILSRAKKWLRDLMENEKDFSSYLRII